MARLLDLGAATVILWTMDHRATGKQAAKPIGVRYRFALVAEHDWLPARIAAAPDLTGRALLAELAARGVPMSFDAVRRFLCEERLT